MEFDIASHFKELSEKAEYEIIGMLNQYDSKKLFYALVASTYISIPRVKPSTHMEQHPIFLLEILGHLILGRSFSGTEDFFYPEVLDQLRGFLYQYSLRLSQPESMDKFTSHIEHQHAMVRGNAFAWQTKDRIYNLFHKYDKIIQKKLGVTLDKILNFVESYSSVVLKKIREGRDVFAASQEIGSIISNITERNGKFVFTKKDGSKIIFGNQDETRQYIDKIIISNFLYKALLVSEENCQDFSLDAGELKAIMSLIGVSKDTFYTVNDIRYYPLFQLDKELILITQNSAFDAVLYHLDNLIKAECGEKFKKHKSNYTENMVFESLCRIFPNDNVYRNLSYPDPTKNDGKSTAELDM